MSAIVYGITKPPACIYYDEKNNCDVRCQCLRDDDLCCLHNKETRKKLYSASWNDQYAMCPIKSIPTPHGRLIDADQLQTAIHGLLCENCVTFPCEKGIGCLIEDVFNLIDEAPTVIEEEHESEARKYVEIGKAISKGLQEGIVAINSEVPE